MIVIEHLNVKLQAPNLYNDLSTEAKNYIYKRLETGYLLFIVPERIESLSDKKVNKAYKVGFLNELFINVYGDKYNKNERYSKISNKYQIYDTNRSIISFINTYDNVFISNR